MKKSAADDEMEGKSMEANSSSRGGWKSAIFIIFVEVAERFSYYGVAGNLFVYMTTVLRLPTATAAKSVNTWRGVSALFPVAGALLADSYFGRFKTILLSSVIYLTGLIALTVAVSAVPPQLRRTVFFVALYILAVGEGGHKPCVQTFAADQFDETIAEEKAAKSSFFNWWYVGIVGGATAAILVVIYVQTYISWSLGFGMLTAAVAAALVVFLIGSGGYRRQAPVGSPFTRVAQVIVAAARKRRLSEREARGVYAEESYDIIQDGAAQALAPTAKFRYLGKATLMDEEDEKEKKNRNRNPWRLCSTTQVEEAKLVFQLVPLWLTCLMFGVVIAQLATFFTKQATAMDRSILNSQIQIPPASFQVFTGLTILVSVLLYQRFLAHRITTLQRIGIGLAISILTMVAAALVESGRVCVARHHGLLDKPNAVVPMAAWWLVPQYVLCGVSDVFTVVGLQELFYDQMPVGMRSVGAAAYITVTGVGSFLSSGLIAIVQAVTADKWLAGDNLNRANLACFYWLLAAMSAVNLCGYAYVAARFLQV
ncbi:protein NRT1/ PTR FAMILY 5.4-like [Andrographis paniculata]|uniref:protein NRT1/ PTR FAMILY 5.4-like n=1 Tax=Andrographis paniculata TaxID=175694 RepID=UPI0021E7E1DE|nr:protein NRT1/ PTR FAMILY 5.4-like [Andrographis paniculata]